MNKLAKLLLVLILGVIVYISGWIAYNYDVIKANRANSNPYPFYTTDINGEHLVAHAGGEIDGHIYTDSYEAYEQSIKNGMQFIEIDLLETTDGDYVAAHDWGMFNASIGKSGDKPISLNVVKQSKIYGKYTPMDEKQIVEFMYKHPNVVMLTDKSRDVKHIAKAFPFHDRMIVQTFHIYDYIKALKAGIKYPTLRLKGGRRGIPTFYKKIIELVNVKSVILGELSFNKNKEFIKKLHDRGVTVILYGNPSYKIVEDAAKISEYAGTYIDLVDTDKLQKL